MYAKVISSKKFSLFKLILTLNTILFFASVNAQDSLYLVNTYTGTTENKLTGANALGDINGDGFDDYCVIYRDSNNLNFSEVYLGGTGFFYKPDTTLSGYLTGIGDINKDGFDDFIKLTYEYPQVTRLFLYYGSNNKYDNNSQLMVSSFYNELIGSFIKNAGDINGDSFDDLMIGSVYNWSNGVGRVYIFYGGVTISEEPDITIIPRNLPDCFVNAGDGIGDINDDGLDDIAIAVKKSNLDGTDSNLVIIYYGHNNTTPEVPNFTIFSNSAYEIYNLNKFGNITGDYKDEFLFNTYDSIYIYSGLNKLYSLKNVMSNLGVIYGQGDLNGDNNFDLIIPDMDFKDDSEKYLSKVNIYFGSNTIDTTISKAILGTQTYSSFGQKTLFLGDLNNDGYDELGITAPSFRGNDTIVGKFYIYSMQKITGVEDVSFNEELKDFSLEQNYPNPFNPNTIIEFTIPEDGNVKFELFNALGQKIKSIAEGMYKAGYNRINLTGDNLTTGVYFYRILFKNHSITKKMTFIK